MTARAWVPLLIVASSALAMLEGVVAHGPSPLRTIAVVWFVSVCPGLAIIGLLRLRDAWLSAALVPALSLSVDVAVGALLSYTGMWSPAAGILILVALSVGCAVAQDAFPGRSARVGRRR
jgi:hypothetical protein